MQPICHYWPRFTLTFLLLPILCINLTVELAHAEDFVERQCWTSISSERWDQIMDKTENTLKNAQTTDVITQVQDVFEKRGGAEEGLHWDLQCLISVAKPSQLVRYAQLRAIADQRQMDSESAVKWALLAYTIAKDIPWPKWVPPSVHTLLDDVELPELRNTPTQSLNYPKNGAVFLDGQFITKVEAHTLMPHLVQVTDKKGKVVAGYWQDSNVFDPNLIAINHKPPKQPKWWSPEDLTSFVKGNQDTDAVADASDSVAAADKAAKDKAAADKAAKDKAAADKVAKDQAAKDKAAKDKAAADKVAKDQAAKDKAAADKAAKDKAAADKAAKDKATADKAAKDKAAADKAAKDKAATDKAAADKTAADKSAADKAAKDKATADKAVKDKADADKAVKDKAAADKAAKDKAAADKAAKDKAAADKAVAAKAEKDKATANKAEKDKAAADKAAVNKAEKDKAAADKAAVDKAEKDKAAKEKAVAAKAEKEEADTKKAAIEKRKADKNSAKKAATNAAAARRVADKKAASVAASRRNATNKAAHARIEKMRGGNAGPNYAMIGIGGGLGLVAGALYAVSVVTKGSLENAATEEELVNMRSLANGLVIGASVTGAAAIGVGVTAFVHQNGGGVGFNVRF